MFSITILVFMLVSGTQGIHLDMGTDENICERTITKLVSHIIYVNKKKVQCNDADQSHCTTTYAIETETRFRTETSTVHECCEGFVAVDGVCIEDETSTVGDTNRLTGSQMSSSMLIGIVSVVVIVILVAVAVIAICVIKRKPKLYYLMKRIRKSSQTDEPHYTEASDYTDGYMEPIKSGVAPNIGNALYKRETMGTRREQNAYTDLRFQNGNKSHDDYTKLNEQKSPPVHKITQFFENKNDDQSSAKPSVHTNKRTNTLPVKKHNIQKETRTKSSPNIRTNEKPDKKTEKNKSQLGKTLDPNTSSENPNVGNENPGVKSLLRKMESLSQMDNDASLLPNNSSTLPRPQRKATSMAASANPSSNASSQIIQRAITKHGKQNTMPRVKPGSIETSGKPQVSLKPAITAQKPNKTSQSSTEPMIPTKKERLNRNKHLNSQTKNTNIKITEEPPAYDDVHFYDYVK